MCYVLLKWTCFFLYELTMSKVSWQTPNIEGVLWAIFIIFPWFILELIILWHPFHFALKQKGIRQLLILLVAFLLEFVIGWCLTNQKFETWMLVKLIFSSGLFILIYRRQVRLFAFRWCSFPSTGRSSQRWICSPTATEFAGERTQKNA
jgi:hypothetical protein